MRRLLSGLAMLLLAVPVSAQLRPGAFTTVTTTDTSTDSLHVGCAVGSSTCTGGIKAGPADVSLVISAGYIGIASNVPADTTAKLYNDGGTLKWAGSALALGGAVGPGTIGKLAKFTGANAVGDSICSELATTLTCVNTISATTLTGTLSTASQTAITGVGTITTGTWTATGIGVAYGGTGANLSGTGGTSQFLRQNSVGAGITVVRPAVADLSDASNVALLNAVNTFTAFGSHSFSANGTGSNGLLVTNTATGAGDFAFLRATGGAVVGQLAAFNQNYTTGTYDVQGSVALTGNGAGGVSIAGTHASGTMRLYTNGTQRWGINAAGDWTFGASSHIMDGAATPTITSGGGTGPSIAGTASAFRVTLGTTPSTTNIVVAFNETFSSAPACQANTEGTTPGAGNGVSAVATTTQVTLEWHEAGNWDATAITVLCRGY